MFDCNAIKSLHKEIGDSSINPQILILDNKDEVCCGFMIDSPYHCQCRDCKDFLINNKYFRKTNTKYIENYDENYKTYKIWCKIVEGGEMKEKMKNQKSIERRHNK